MVEITHDSSTATVQYPRERHGHAGKTSHAAKVDAKKDYLMFVDLNSQPNGRSADSTSANHFLLPKFRTTVRVLNFAGLIFVFYVEGNFVGLYFCGRELTIIHSVLSLVSRSQTATFLLCGGGKSRVWYNDNRNPVQAFTSFQ